MIWFIGLVTLCLVPNSLQTYPTSKGLSAPSAMVTYLPATITKQSDAPSSSYPDVKASGSADSSWNQSPDPHGAQSTAQQHGGYDDSEDTMDDSSSKRGEGAAGNTADHNGWMNLNAPGANAVSSYGEQESNDMQKNQGSSSDGYMGPSSNGMPDGGNDWQVVNHHQQQQQQQQEQQQRNAMPSGPIYMPQMPMRPMPTLASIPRPGGSIIPIVIALHTPAQGAVLSSHPPRVYGLTMGPQQQLQSPAISLALVHNNQQQQVRGNGNGYGQAAQPSRGMLNEGYAQNMQGIQEQMQQAYGQMANSMNGQRGNADMGYGNGVPSMQGMDYSAIQMAPAGYNMQTRPQMNQQEGWSGLRPSGINQVGSTRDMVPIVQPTSYQQPSLNPLKSLASSLTNGGRYSSSNWGSKLADSMRRPMLARPMLAMRQPTKSSYEVDQSGPIVLRLATMTYPQRAILNMYNNQDRRNAGSTGY